jgi:hypothetical protein
VEACEGLLNLVKACESKNYWWQLSQEGRLLPAADYTSIAKGFGREIGFF